MRRWQLFPAVVVAAVAMLAGGLAAFAPASLAQGTTGTPDAMGTPGAAGHNHPAHIHLGTCAAIGDVVYPLDNLTDADETGTPVAGMDASPMAGMAGTPTAGTGEVVAQSTTTVEASLDDILAGEHAVNVHESPENIQTYVACGDLTGAAEGGRLQIELSEQNGSGYRGMAVLEDGGDGTTTVTVTLVHTMDGMATPAA